MYIEAGSETFSFAQLGIFLFLYIGLILLSMIAMFLIIKKSEHPQPWLCFIPVVNYTPMLNIIGKSGWHVLWLMVPFVNVYFMIKWLVLFHKAYGLSAWVTVLWFTPFILVVLLYMAFSRDVEYEGTLYSK
ncbi:hypothetical protein IMZ31_20065 (plasmid) [Pontibacillus sp. ALD_SL1]|uniref:DUF5684 domain-containing protein n=1 Tax=Pontibacillus sp. ALD_SL1 TaxID=2777185 RepID=UPI001A95BDD5|nr:DUF5684 domain-containing protein [Pontibacillus sp. ALD_SL1]QST02848.1 hypothetical protein IMZ31_20065 [Pontibacillus sp. ALD_SL1]